MIFVDTNLFNYAVGRPHPLRGPARAFFAESIGQRGRLCTSAEVLQARDLCHLASCLRRGVREIKTFDQRLAEVSSFLFSS